MKAYSKPELNVLHIGKEICTDIIVASGEQSFGDINNVGAAGRIRDINDWYEGN